MGCFVATNGWYDWQGRILAYKPNTFRMVTFKLLYPPPCGVVIGPFKKILFRRRVSQAAGGIPEEMPLK